MSLEAIHENLLRRAAVGDLISRSADRFRDKIAFVSGNERVSYRTLNEKSCMAANAFARMNIKKGDRVAFMTHNCLTYLYCFFGLTKIGAIPVPLNFMLRGEEIIYIINDAGPKAFFVEDSIAEHVLAVKNDLKSVEHFGWIDFGKKPKPDGWVDLKEFFQGDYPATEPEVIINSDDVATLIYTTGTESFPKGVMTTHLNYYMSLLHLLPDVDFRNDDVFIIDIPFFHVAGNTVLLGMLAVGGRAVIEYAPDPYQTLQKTQDEKITYWVYPPTLYAAIPTVPGFDKYDLSSLKKFVSFGAVIPTVVIERWKEINPDIQWRNYWGQTESSPVGTTSSPADFESKQNSIGIPDTGVFVKIFDENDQEVSTGQIGELVIRGAAVMKGYWNRDDLTKQTLANGWLHTGDLGYMDEDGYIYFVDRKKDMIKTGGENVSSQEVEGIIQRYPGVAMVAVIGLPDPYWMEVVSAFVVPRPGQELTEEAIIGFCKENMAGYKVPKKVFIASALPMTASGKILKRKIREEYTKEG
ncbi:MAG: AMP-binding protein [Deltaproteobacteria bacterium]|nr:AMP-binding protein [Deltaproteobacteria bacterium]